MVERLKVRCKVGRISFFPKCERENLTKIVRCVAQTPITDKDVWVYPWKEYVGVASFSDYCYTMNNHRVPSFLSLHAHLAIEHCLEKLWHIFDQFPFKSLFFVYDFLHGIICSYNMREILKWWSARKDDGTISETLC